MPRATCSRDRAAWVEGHVDRGFGPLSRTEPEATEDQPSSVDQVWMSMTPPCQPSPNVSMSCACRHSDVKHPSHAYTVLLDHGMGPQRSSPVKAALFWSSTNVTCNSSAQIPVVNTQVAPTWPDSQEKQLPSSHEAEGLYPTVPGCVHPQSPPIPSVAVDELKAASML